MVGLSPNWAARSARFCGKEHVIFDYSFVLQFVAYQVLFGYLTLRRHFSSIEANMALVEPSHAGDLIAFIREQSGSTGRLRLIDPLLFPLGEAFFPH